MDKLNKILVLIDCQNDFIDQKKGALAVKGAEDIMNALARYINAHGDDYEAVFVTCDYHPLNHCSFIGNKDDKGNKGQWPMHCVNNSWGAAIYQPIMDAIANMHQKGKEVYFINKGTDKNKEEYSAFSYSLTRAYFSRIHSNHKVSQIDICGIAGDYCVSESIKDLITEGYTKELFVMSEFIPSIDDGTTLNNLIKDFSLNHSA